MSLNKKSDKLTNIRTEWISLLIFQTFAFLNLVHLQGKQAIFQLIHLLLEGLSSHVQLSLQVQKINAKDNPIITCLCQYNADIKLAYIILSYFENAPAFEKVFF